MLMYISHLWPLPYSVCERERERVRACVYSSQL